MENKLHVTFHGGVGTVTGANFLLEDEKTRILIDCGLLQGLAETDMENRKSFPYDTRGMNFLFITHIFQVFRTALFDSIHPQFILALE